MKKRYLIMIIITIILVLCLGAGIAFAYFFTDLFKSNKQLFSKYIMQNKDIVEILEEKEIKAYSDKKKSTPYSSEGTIKANVTFPDSSQAQLASALQNCNITFNGKVDNANNYFYETVKANYSDTQSMEFNLYRNQDIFAFKITDIVFKYIGIENSNLKAFFQKMGVSNETLEMIPDKIDFDKLLGSFDVFTDEDTATLKAKYLKLISDNLNDNMFSKESSSENTIYTLTINEKQSINLLKILLENFKDDDIIINNIKSKLKENTQLTEEEINQYIAGYYTKELSSAIDILDSYIDKADENNTFTIKVYANNGSLQKTEIDFSEAYKLIISKSSDGFRLELNDSQSSNSYSLSVQKIKSINEIKYDISAFMGSTQIFDLTVAFTGLNTDSVHESSELNFEYDLGNSSLTDAKTKISYIYSTTKKFEEITKEDVLNENVLLINTAPSAESIKNLFEQIGTKVVEQNNAKLKTLGLTNENNPFIYYIPSIVPASATYVMQNPNQISYFVPPMGIAVISCGIIVYNNASTTIAESQMSKIEKENFNNKFTTYSGTNKTKSDITALYSAVINSNSEEKSNGHNHIVKINNAEPISIPNDLDTNKTYTIKLEYDVNGYINNIIYE